MAKSLKLSKQDQDGWPFMIHTSCLLSVWLWLAEILILAMANILHNTSITQKWRQLEWMAKSLKLSKQDQDGWPFMIHTSCLFSVWLWLAEILILAMANILHNTSITQKWRQLEWMAKSLKLSKQDQDGWPFMIHTSCLFSVWLWLAEILILAMANILHNTSITQKWRQLEWMAKSLKLSKQDQDGWPFMIHTSCLFSVWLWLAEILILAMANILHNTSITQKWRQLEWMAKSLKLSKQDQDGWPFMIHTSCLFSVWLWLAEILGKFVKFY